MIMEGYLCVSWKYKNIKMEENQNTRVVYMECVKELNAELFDRFGETEVGFGYSTNGYVDIIDFNGMMIWHSDMDGREWIADKNDYEPIEPFIKLVFNKWIDKLYGLKMVDGEVG